MNIVLYKKSNNPKIEGKWKDSEKNEIGSYGVWIVDVVQLLSEISD